MPALLPNRLPFLLKKRSENRREIERKLGEIQGKKNRGACVVGLAALSKVQETEVRTGFVKRAITTMVRSFGQAC